MSNTQQSHVPEVTNSLVVKKVGESRIYFELTYLYQDQALGETQARTAVAQMHDIIVAEPQKKFTILVKLAEQKEVTAALDENRAYLDIILHKQVSRIAIVFDEARHSKSVAFIVNVFQKLTDKIRLFQKEEEAVVWLDEVS